MILRTPIRYYAANGNRMNFYAGLLINRNMSDVKILIVAVDDSDDEVES